MVIHHSAPKPRAPKRFSRVRTFCPPCRGDFYSYHSQWSYVDKALRLVNWPENNNHILVFNAKKTRSFYSKPMDICKKVFGVLSTPDLGSCFSIVVRIPLVGYFFLPNTCLVLTSWLRNKYHE